ncbi:MAG: hypothetical protein K6F99_09695 [Lachnospiraceae bacterium]|nr:hypothetical protein [Lachnospiraceae bacterium]
MKKLIMFIVVFIIALTTPCYAKSRFSPETERLMKEAGLLKGEDMTVDEVMQRQEELNRQKAEREAAKNRCGASASSADELHINPAAQSTVSGNVRVTDTNGNDELHIYSNEYSVSGNYGTKMSNDEFHVYGAETPANDGYSTSGFDELHIPSQYRKNLWRPEGKVYRLGIDEFRLPNDMN